MGAVQLVTEGHTASLLFAIGLVVIQTQTEHQIGGIKVQTALTENRAVGPAVLCEVAGAIDFVKHDLRTQNQLMNTGRQGVFPARGARQGVERAGIGSEGILFVTGFRELDTCAPVVTGNRFQMQPHGTDQEIGITAFKLGITFRLEHRQPGAATLVKTVAQFGQATSVPESFVLAASTQVRAIGIRINATGQERRVAFPASQSGRYLTGFMGTAFQLAPTLAPGLRLQGERLDDTTHRIGTVEGALRAPHQLNPLHQFRRQKLPGWDTCRGRAQADTIKKQHGT